MTLQTTVSKNVSISLPSEIVDEKHDIFQSAEGKQSAGATSRSGPPANNDQQRLWHYSVPMAGVRYYSYDSTGNEEKSAS